MAPAVEPSGLGDLHLCTCPTTIGVQIGSTDAINTVSLLDSGAGPLLIQEETALLYTKPEDWNTSRILNISGVGNSRSLRFITTTLYIPDIKERLLECKAELHVVCNFTQKLCLGMDFIKNYNINLLQTKNSAHFTTVDASV